MAHGQSAYMGLVDHGAIPVGLRPGMTPPGERRIYDPGLGHEGRTVALVEAQVRVRRAYGVAEQGLGPLQLADQLLGVGVDQQLVRVETVAGIRLVGPVDPIAVDHARVGIGQVSMPDLVGIFRQFDAPSSRLPWLSNRQSSTLVACAENSAKFTPRPSQVAPRGKGWPSAIRERCWAVRPWLLPLLAFMVDYSWAESASDFGSLILVVRVTGGLRALALLRAAGLPSSAGFSS